MDIVNLSKVLEKKMSKFITVLLFLICSFGIISCGERSDPVSKALDQPNSTDNENSLSLPSISGTCYLHDNSTHENSTIDNSTISDNSSITNSTVKNCSTVTSGSTIDNSTIDNSTINQSNVDNSSTIDNSTISDVSDVDNSYVCNSRVDNSTIDNSTVCLSIVGDNSTIRHSNVDNNSTIDNSTITDSDVDNSTMRDSNFDNSTTGGGSNFDNVTGDNVTCVNCDLIDLICNGCILDNATVCNATLDNVTLTNVSACEDGVIMDFDNVTYEDETMTETDAPYVAAATKHNSFPLTDNISVTFNESMNTATIITSVGTASCSGATLMVSIVDNGTANDNFSTNACESMRLAPVASNDNKTYTLDPTNSLQDDNEYYYIRVTTGAKDTSGNSLSGNGHYGWTNDNVSIFRTEK